MVKKKIIFYTDCYLFGGCEKTIFEIVSSCQIAANFNYLLIYRSSKIYKKIMHLSWPAFDYHNTREMRFFDIHTFNLWLEEKIQNKLLLKVIKNIEQIIYPILMPFIFLYECMFLLIVFFRQKADYIHINNGGYPGALSCRAACLAAKLSGTKYILMKINNLAWKYDGFFDRAVDFFVKKTVSKIIVGSKSSGNALKINRNFDVNKIVHIYNGIEPYVSSPVVSIRHRHITIVASFEERKGHKYAVLAFKKMLAMNPQDNDVKLILIGDGPLLSQSQELVSKEGLGESILFLGRKVNYLDYMVSSLFLVVPSLYDEESPYIIVEAMSLGIPVIGTDLGGISEQIKDGNTGFVVPAADIGRLTKAMFILLSDDEKRRQMGLAAKNRYFDMFTKDRMINNYLTLYRALENKHNFLN